MIKPNKLVENIVRVQEKEPSRYYKTRLDRSERTHPFSNEFIDNIRRKFDGEWLMTYPEPGPLYDKFSEFINQPAERILFHNGSDQCIKAVFETFTGQGDKLLLHKPGYAMFPVYARLYGAETEFQEYDSNLKFEYESYIDRIDSSFKMAVLENPNGFIGSAPPEDKLRAFIEKCEESGVLAVVDEAYYYFHDITAANWLDEYENLIVIRTFSKAWGIAGLRAGYTLSRKENIANLYRIKPMHELNAFAILVLDELLNNPEELHAFVRDTADNLSYLRQGFNSIGIDTSDSVANFLAARVGRYFPGVKLSDKMQEEGILLRRPFREEALAEWTRVGTASKVIMDRVLLAAKELIEEGK